MTIKIVRRTTNARVGNPIVPRKAEDPAGQFGTLRSARAELRRRTNRIKDGVRTILDSFTPKIVTNAYYEYQIDVERFNGINSYLQQLLYESFLDNQQGELSNRWWLRSFINDAAEDGISDALKSAQNMATVDIVGQELSQAMRLITAESVIFSPQFQNRVGFLLARTFNSMKGLTDSAKSDLADTLARSMAAGKGIRDVKSDIMARIDVSESRAWRIARTEILNSYRTNTTEETKQLNDSVYGDSVWQMQQLWWSALAPTTRPHHAARHSNIYTLEQIAEFYSKDGNAVYCLCSSSPILVNMQTGEVIQQSLIDKMKKQREAWKPTSKR